LIPLPGTFKEFPLIEGKKFGPHGLLRTRRNIWYTANFGGYMESSIRARKGDEIQDA